MYHDTRSVNSVRTLPVFLATMLISGTIISIIGVTGFASENAFADKNDVKKNAESNKHAIKNAEVNKHANKNAEGNFFFSHAYSVQH
jgi:hypothetical protein